MDVSAGLEIDVQSAVSGALAGSFQRLFFSMAISSSAVEAFACQQTARVDNDGADHWVGARAVFRLARQLDGARGPKEVCARVVICGIQSWQYTRAKIRPPSDRQPKGLRDSPVRSSAGSVEMLLPSV